MTWVYAGILSVMEVIMMISRRFGKELFRSLDPKEHPLRRLYPTAAAFLLAGDRVKRTGRSTKLNALLKNLYVKENIEKEKYLYRLKKTASLLAVFAGVMFLGFFVCLANEGIRYIQSLERGEHGQGSIDYELEADYRGGTDPVHILIEPVAYTESEILELFDRAYEEVKQIVLGDNISQDHVTEPLHLIPEYNGISIFWEIEDLSAVNYAGSLKAELREGETKTVTLYAVFSMDDVTETFLLPIALAGQTRKEQERLLDGIREKIEKNNDVHSKEVVLPEEVDGYRIRFHTKRYSEGYLFLLLAAGAVIVILLFYDRNLEKQVKKRQEQMMVDFTEIVTKLSLLYDAGLSIHGAFERVVSDYEKRIREKPSGDFFFSKRKKVPAQTEYHFAYREMKLVLEKIRRGSGEAQAYSQFGKRCGLYPYIKLGNLLEQNLNKGTRGMQQLLKKEVEDAFEERKRIARKKGEEAGTKLLIPMVMMLAVVIAIVAVPALMSMRF